MNIKLCFLGLMLAKIARLSGENMGPGGNPLLRYVL
jgi:hypothetical protein